MSKQLKAAIEQNDPGLARKAVKALKDPNRRMAGSTTPVLLACTLGADRVLPVLVEAGAKVKGVDGYAGHHPFAVAAKHGRTAVLWKLAEMNQAPDDAIDHALFEAAADGRDDVLRYLVQHLRPNPGAMIVRVAAHSKSAAAVRAVAEGTGAINATEDPAAGECGGVTPLHSCVGYADVGVVRLLVELGADVDARDALGRTPLMVAGFEMERLRMTGEDAAGVSVIRELLRLGADATLADFDGNDAIDHYAFQLLRSRHDPDPAVIDLLRTAGAKGSGATHRLFVAVRDEDLEAVRAAIRDGADVNRLAPPYWNATPLTMAAGRTTEFVSLLLAAGADVNKPDRREIPLIAAAGYGNLEVVVQLVEAGADVEALEVRAYSEEAPRRNAYLAAEQRGKHDVVDYLKSLGGGRPRPGPDWKPVAARVHHWNDFVELLVKGDVGPVARGLAKVVGGSAEPQAYGRSFLPRGRAYVVVRPRGMRWCNVLRLAPAPSWEPDRPFYRKLADACGSPVLWVGYSDTSGAAAVERYEPDGGRWEDQGWDRATLEEVVHNFEGEAPAWMKQKLAELGEETEDELSSSGRLEKLAADEAFAVAALYLRADPGRPVEVSFDGLPAEAFDGVAWVGE